MRLYGKNNIKLYRSTYANNNSLAVTAEDKHGYLFTVITVNLNESNTLPPTQAFVDVNNNPNIVVWLIHHKIAEPTGAFVQSGFVMYPLMEFNLDKIERN